MSYCRYLCSLQSVLLCGGLWFSIKFSEPNGRISVLEYNVQNLEKKAKIDALKFCKEKGGEVQTNENKVNFCIIDGTEWNGKDWYHLDDDFVWKQLKYERDVDGIIINRRFEILK